MRKSVLLSLIVWFILPNFAEAQKMRLKRAHQYFENLDYQQAISEYSDILDKHDDSQAKINLAECFRKVQDYENAEYWYGHVVRLSDAKPVHILRYGMMLQINGKCDLAKDWYEKFVKLQPNDQRGQHLVRACDYEGELIDKNEGIYEVQNMPFNSENDDICPMFYQDKIIFSTEQQNSYITQRTHTWTGNPFHELVTVDAELIDEENQEYEYGPKQLFSKAVNSRYHDAAVSFSENESILYFTRNNFVEGKVGKDDNDIVRLKIYWTYSDGKGGWNKLDRLPFNSDEYSVAHPAVSPDGTMLFFASDMPGGFGGMDIYVSYEDNGKWGFPYNLGPQVNTEGHEVFPFYHENGLLYFASDGHVGLGGLDIHSVKQLNEYDWGEVTNLGYPLNSKKDDFGYILNEAENFGYFTSNREGGVGDDDIYSFRKDAVKVKIYVFDEASGKPIPQATIKNDYNKVVLRTDKTGYAYMDIPRVACAEFLATADGYGENTKKGCGTSSNDKNEVIVEIPLNPLEAEYRFAGLVLDADTKEPIEGAKVILISDCGEPDQEMITNSSGGYEFDVEEGCCYKIKSTLTGYLAGVLEKQCTDDVNEYGVLVENIIMESYLVTESILNRNNGNNPNNPNDPYGNSGTGDYSSTNRPYNGNPSSSQFNGSSNPNEGDYYDEKTGRYYTQQGAYGFGSGLTPVDEIGSPRSFLLHIYYDFDQSYIREDAEDELDKLYRLLIENPEVIVEIGSHTDSRGSHRYNKLLSQRRAESVVRWLKSRGITRERLVARGYGENINVNECKNNVPCSEYEHQLNRRTEFKIVGVQNGGVIESFQPDNVLEGKNCEGCPF